MAPQAPMQGPGPNPKCAREPRLLFWQRQVRGPEEARAYKRPGLGPGAPACGGTDPVPPTANTKNRNPRLRFTGLWHAPPKGLVPLPQARSHALVAASKGHPPQGLGPVDEAKLGRPPCAPSPALHKALRQPTSNGPGRPCKYTPAATCSARREPQVAPLRQAVPSPAASGTANIGGAPEPSDGSPVLRTGGRPPRTVLLNRRERPALGVGTHQHMQCTP